ncbi:hypothetical protein SS1G_09719 [Paecilomyces variotii No. 5]|uniref:FAD/NAD(P)-binding domain-containing protein n=1 Tax=Byssochlamys spectabilis (strain No. 5 / NBRC 109023) TaxID=1356009 RepID=V5F7V8_BYSSN|nr:hypothetical protein SS1G_09719 [Paecilomyces variotii No. 5]
MTRTIVILGASISGLAIAHKLLKHTYPQAKDIKVVLVNPSDRLYWNLASVRYIVPGQFKDEDLFQPFLPGFERYPKESFEFIQGSAEKVDPSNNTVVVSGGQTIHYEYLVVATGASYKDDMPWKPLKDYQTTVDSVHEIQNKVAAAKTIVIGGGGATGSEVAGEIAHEYHKKGKEVTIVTANKHLIPSLPEYISEIAEKELVRLDVKIVRNTKITDAVPTPDGKTKLSLSTNEPDMLVDLYLPTIGEKSNTHFLPLSLVNESGDVLVDEFLRVRTTSNVWAAGDVTGLESKQAKYAEEQALHLARNLDNVLQGKEPVPYGANSMRALAVTLGRSKGTGIAGRFRIPSIAVWLLKGRYLGSDKLKSIANGDRSLVNTL